MTGEVDTVLSMKTYSTILPYEKGSVKFEQRGSLANIHAVARNSSSRDPTGSSGLCRHTCGTRTYILAKHPFT